MEVRINDGYLHEFVKENPRGMKNAANKREIRISVYCMRVCRHPGLFFRVHPAGQKKNYHFEVEKIALILIYVT